MLLKRKRHVLAATQSASPSVPYSTLVIADGPAAYWRCNETSGTTINDSIGTRHATITPPVTLGVVGFTPSDKAILVGTAGKVVPSSFPTTGTTFTVEAWVKPTAQPGSSPYGIITRQVFGDGDFQFEYRNGPVIRFYYYVTSPQIYNTSLLLVNNSWYHLVITGGSGQLILYVNGIAQTPFAATIGGNGAGPGGLGSYAEAGTDTWNFIGPIQDLAFYQKVLTPTQILAHYKNRVP